MTTSIETTVVTLLLALLAVPFWNNCKLHTMTIGGCALYVSSFYLAAHLILFDSSAARTSRRKPFSLVLLQSFFAGVATYLFLPSILEFLPPPLLTPFVKFPYGSGLYPDISNIEHLSIMTYENLTMTEAIQIVSEATEPLHFKGLLKESIERGETILDRLHKVDGTFLMQKFDAKPYDFFRGSRFTTGHKGTISDVLQGNISDNNYISFEPLLLEEEIKDLFDLDADDVRWKNIIVDNSFVSNFTESIVTTFVHAAPASTSWSIQMIGSKTWYLWDPANIIDPFNCGWFCFVSVPSHGDEAALFQQPSMRVKVEAGDVLTFPPLWFHLVATQKGPNLMLNIRTRIGNWLPPMIPAVRFFSGKLMNCFLGDYTSNPHHQPGIRKIRMTDLQNIFEENPRALRWESVDNYIN